MEMGEIDYI